MTKREFLKELEGQLELPEGSLHGNHALTEIEGWDSLAAVMFIALADEKIGVTISGNQIANSKTMDELLSLLGDKLSA
jgi:acyl carrier protein